MHITFIADLLFSYDKQGKENCLYLLIFSSMQNFNLSKDIPIKIPTYQFSFPSSLNIPVLLTITISRKRYPC